MTFIMASCSFRALSFRARFFLLIGRTGATGSLL